MNDAACSRARLERHLIEAAIALGRVEREIATLLAPGGTPAPGAPGFAARRNALHLARDAAERELRCAARELLDEAPEPTEPPAPEMSLEGVVEDALRVLRLNTRVHDVCHVAESTADERAAAIRARNAAEDRLRREVAAWVRASAAAELSERRPQP